MLQKQAVLSEYAEPCDQRPVEAVAETCDKQASAILAHGGIMFCVEKAMYFEQFYLGCLAHASYMLASEGEAVVVDPQRDVEIYLEAAKKHNLQIRYIFETHLHADFVSGHNELAARTGATIYIGKAAGATFPHVDVSGRL